MPLSVLLLFTTVPLYLVRLNQNAGGVMPPITTPSQWLFQCSYSLPLYLYLLRLNQNAGDGAWCPQSVHPASIGPSEFLQITFRDPTVITVMALQGRHNYGYGAEYARRVRLEYSRDSETWMRYTNMVGEEVR